MTPPPVSRIMPEAIARYGKFAVFMHETRMHLYEIPPGGLASNPYQTCKHLAAVADLPARYLRTKTVAEVIRLAAEEIRSREGLVVR